LNIKIFRNLFDNLKVENKLLKFVVLVIGGVVVFNSFMIQAALERQTTILIPPGLDAKVVVSGGKLNDEYVRTFSRYLADLVLTYAPTDVEGKFDDALLLFDTSVYPEYYKAFYDLAGIVKKKNISAVFYMTQPIHVDNQSKTIKIEGIARRYKDNEKLEDSVKRYEFQYRIDNGRGDKGILKIVKFGEKEIR
jgi:conjugal transfer pilus assembly protein TraE